jgi:hypothetical protein
MKVNIENYSIGTAVVCVLNNRATLTIGKEYIVEAVQSYNDEHTLWIKNDDNIHYEYEAYRFIPKSEFRQHTINQILK